MEGTRYISYSFNPKAIAHMMTRREILYKSDHIANQEIY